MMRSKNWLYFVVTLMLSIGMLAACGSPEEEETTENQAGSQTVEFDIGTAGTGGALYPMGTAMAQTITENSDEMAASAISTGGSVENIRQLVSGEQGVAIASSEMAYFAYNGEDQYEGNSVDDIRGLFGSINQWALAITRADSGITSISELDGKRVGVGAPGSGGENTARKILETYDVTYDDITEEYLSDGEMAEGLRDGTLDAFFITNPLNSATLMELSSSVDIQLLPVDEPSFYEEYPYFVQEEVPAETYPGQDTAVPTPINRILFVTMNDGQLSDEQVRDMLEILWDNQDGWIESHAAVAADTSFEEAIEGMTIPLHRGAVEYYESQGFEIPEELIPSEVE